MAYTLSPLGAQQFLDANGNPLASGALYAYAAGTSTPQDTFSNSSGTPHTHPITLNAGGWVATAAGATSGLYLSATSYDFTLKDAAGVTIWGPITVQSTELLSSGVYEIFSFGGADAVPITATTYPVGTTFDKCHAGTGWFVRNSAAIAAGTYKLSGMLLSSNAANTVTAALVNLTDGSPETPLATIASTSATGENVISTAITFAAAGTDKNYAVKVKTSAGYGLAWALQLIRTA